MVLLARLRPARRRFRPRRTACRRVAVEQPVNRTGDDLVVDRPGLVAAAPRGGERDGARPPRRGPRNALGHQGFRLAEPAGDAPVLRTEISRWQHYAADYDTVTVDVMASLVDPASGRELWSAARPGWVVATYDAGSRRDGVDRRVGGHRRGVARGLAAGAGRC